MNNKDRILVTGGAGFIGSSLVEILVKSNYPVKVLDNLSTGNLENISKCMDAPNIVFLEGDMLNRAVLENAVDNSNIVFHFAANPSVSLERKNPSEDFLDLRATFNLLNAMRKSVACKKLYFASSSTVYGEPEILSIPESYSPLLPISIYGGSKLACEALISGFCHMFNMSATIFRLANIVGPRNTHGVIYDLVKKLRICPTQLEILGDGYQKKSYLYIDDCIDAILHVFNKFRIRSDRREIIDVYNVGSIDSITVLEIVNIIIEKMSLRNVTINPTRGTFGRGWKGDVRRFLLDVSKIRILGWQAKYNSGEAVARTVAELVSDSPL